MLLSEIVVGDIWGPVSINGLWIVDITDTTIVIGGIGDALFGDEVLELIEQVGANFDCEIVKEL